MFQICHHQVTFLKHFPTLVFVYISLVLSIGSLHVRSHLGMNLQSLFCHTIHCFASSKYGWHDGLIINMVWGISIDNLKRCFANRLIHHIVVNKLNMWQYSLPVPLLINTNITQHIFQSSFDYLCLSICLKKEGTTKLQLHVKFILQMMPKLTSELPIPVRINSLWNIM